MKRTDFGENITQQRIKENHQKQIVLLSIKNNGVSKAQIRRELHISFPSASALADELLTRNVLVENGVEEGTGRGRPCTILQVNLGNYAIPVISMNPNGFETYLFDLSGKLLEHSVQPIDYRKEKLHDGFYNVSDSDLAEPIVQWIEQIQNRYQIFALIISIYGSIIHGVFSSSSVLHIKVTEKFFLYIEEKAGIDVIIGNNTTYYAYGEKQLRADVSDFIFVNIGNGVGAGVIRDGRIHEEGPVQNGEIGHISIDYRGKPCACGNKGCLEQYVSVHAIEDAAGMPFEQVCAAYRKRDKRIVELLEETAEKLAVGVSSMLTMQFVGRVIIGGEIQKLGPLFLETLEEQAKRVGMRKVMDQVSFEYAYIGDDGDAYGAFWDYMEHYFRVEKLMK